MAERDKAVGGNDLEEGHVNGQVHGNEKGQAADNGQGKNARRIFDFTAQGSHLGPAIIGEQCGEDSQGKGHPRLLAAAHEQHLAVALPQAEDNEQYDGEQFADRGQRLDFAGRLDTDTVDNGDEGQHRGGHHAGILAGHIEQGAEDGAEITRQGAHRARAEEEYNHPAVQKGGFFAENFFQKNVHAARAGKHGAEFADR